ncbi:MAG: YvcK family protein [Patescibacteria group bacterium]|nr:YvcK family protein [Patescibacteria group bacterium]
MKKVTVIGGGTGTFVVLSGLKKFDLDLGVIVTMMDSGGSTGRLRDQLGVLPPGDLRQCLVALSEAPALWRKLFLYRFENGDLKGHNFGNIFLSALEKVSDDYSQVIDSAEYVLKTKGEVVPVTFEKAHLCVEYESGKKLCGEGYIDENNHETSRIVNAYVEPDVAVNPRARERIAESDYVVIGPGDLYTSIIPVLVIDGIAEVLRKSKATIIYNMNLMTKMGQTYHYTAAEHVRDLERYIGRQPDVVICNSGSIDPATLEWYNKHNEIPVSNNLSGNFTGKIIEADLIDRNTIEKQESDELTRSILRHDSWKLAEVLKKILV